VKAYYYLYGSFFCISSYSSKGKDNLAPRLFDVSLLWGVIKVLCSVKEDR
jgi:hypothetical protein